MKQIVLIFLLTIGLGAKTITPNDVYTLGKLIQDHTHFLLKHYKIKHHHEDIAKSGKILSTKLKPRNIWQKSYEILVKINMLRQTKYLSRIEPVGVGANKNLNPDMVYEMNERILTELRIFETREDIAVPKFKQEKFKNKTPLDNYNLFVNISASFDELNKRALTPNYVYAETMRIYEDLSIILEHLNIQDFTTPGEKILNAKPKDAMNTAMKMLKEVEILQRSAGIESIDFVEFNKKNVTPSDVFTITGIIISEIQPIKAHIGLTRSVTPPAHAYEGKKPENVEQLMQWNLQRIRLIKTLQRGNR